MFLENGKMDPKCHAGYREAVLRVGKDTDTKVVDFTSLTEKKLEEVGYDDSREFFMNFDAGIYENYPEGKNDNTHLRMKGAQMVRDLFLKEMQDDLKFKEYLNV